MTSVKFGFHQATKMSEQPDPGRSASPAEGLWDFSLRIYRRPGVSEACLMLQDTAGADVNIILFCLWLAAARNPPLTPETLASLDHQVAAWRSGVIEPLRAIRRAFNDFSGLSIGGHVKNQIRQAEFEAEHAEQILLQSLAGEPRPGSASIAPPAHDIAIASLNNYLGVMGRKRADRFDTLLEHLVDDALQGQSVSS